MFPFSCKNHPVKSPTTVPTLILSVSTLFKVILLFLLSNYPCSLVLRVDEGKMRMRLGVVVDGSLEGQAGSQREKGLSGTGES